MRSTSLLRQAAAQATAPDAYAKSLAYATDLVRRTDHEAIYASHFYPGDVRPAYLALRALNAELAGLPDQVSHQLVGRMRFQWWKDAIKGLYDVSLSLTGTTARDLAMPAIGSGRGTDDACAQCRASRRLIRS